MTFGALRAMALYGHTVSNRRVKTILERLVPQDSSGTTDDEHLVAKMRHDQSMRATQRRDAIEAQFAQGDLGDEHVRVGLKAFHGICDRWAIGEAVANAVLGSTVASTSIAKPELLERLSYVLRIFRLLEDVVQGDDDRKQRWLRRAMPAFDGQRPIDLIASGPRGSATVMEYLEYSQQAHFH